MDDKIILPEHLSSKLTAENLEVVNLERGLPAPMSVTLRRLAAEVLPDLLEQYSSENVLEQLDESCLPRILRYCDS